MPWWRWLVEIEMLQSSFGTDSVRNVCASSGASSHVNLWSREWEGDGKGEKFKCQPLPF